jgi:hypothetical protein
LDEIEQIHVAGDASRRDLRFDLPDDRVLSPNVNDTLGETHEPFAQPLDIPRSSASRGVEGLTCAEAAV